VSGSKREPNHGARSSAEDETRAQFYRPVRRGSFFSCTGCELDFRKRGAHSRAQRVSQTTTGEDLLCFLLVTLGQVQLWSCSDMDANHEQKSNPVHSHFFPSEFTK
jgi:hypothetical protein